MYFLVLMCSSLLSQMSHFFFGIFDNGNQTRASNKKVHICSVHWIKRYFARTLLVPVLSISFHSISVFWFHFLLFVLFVLINWCLWAFLRHISSRKVHHDQKIRQQRLNTNQFAIIPIASSYARVCTHFRNVVLLF